MCCNELQSALDDKDSGFSVVSNAGVFHVRMDLGAESYIDTETCVFCESKIPLNSIETYLKKT
jgi:hypothetical protein